MYLLYLDGSGTVNNRNEKHFILAGVAVFEKQIYHLLNNTDDFVSALNLGNHQNIELHCNKIASGGGHPWRHIPVRAAREKIINGGLQLLADTRDNVKLFAVVVDKQACQSEDPVEYAFKEICSRFNSFLTRIYNRHNDAQRGLIVMDESGYENTLQKLAHGFRKTSASWGNLNNLAEVPFFVDSKATRLIQLTDMLAWAVWRRYEYNESDYINIVADKFDAEGGVIKGLVHHKPSTTNCTCPVCV